jgi:hypothetical protein
MRHLNRRWAEWLAAAGGVVFVLAILFPAAGLARGGGKVGICRVNIQILGRAWQAYADEYDGRLVGGSNYYDNQKGTPYRWVEVPLYRPTDNPEHDPVPSSGELTLEHRLNGIKSGKLYPYIQKTHVYRCPADRSWVKETPSPSWPFRSQPYRSYAIGGLMNGEDYGQREGLYGPITWYRTVTFPTGTKTLINAERQSQIRRPAEKFVFIEEDAWSHGLNENAGSFILMADYNPDEWWDWPAVFHPDEGMLEFADGHVEGRVWKDPRTVNLIRTGDWKTMVQPDNADLQWLIRRYLAGEP